MTPPKKPPAPREITYQIGRKTGTIHVSPEGGAAKPQVTGRESGSGRQGGLFLLAFREAPYPPAAVLLLLLLASPFVAAALAAFLLHYLIG